MDGEDEFQIHPRIWHSVGPGDRFIGQSRRSDPGRRVKDDAASL
jgi:hypothetical protein